MCMCVYMCVCVLVCEIYGNSLILKINTDVSGESERERIFDRAKESTSVQCSCGRCYTGLSALSHGSPSQTSV